MAGPGAGLRVSAAPRETDGAAGREEFFLRTSRPGRYTLEGRMIGYGTVETEPFRLGPGQTVNRRIEMGVEAIALEGIDARVGARCEPHPDATEEGQRLWDQVKTALTAVALTDGAVRIRLLARTFERDVDVHRDLVVRERVDTAEIVRSQPFRSLSVYTLLRRGFRESVGDTTIYYGPDAEVLLSESFLATHCFWAVDGGDGRVGLAFKPIPERRGMEEIQGTLWLDGETAALDRLEFEYLHMRPRERPYDFGGEVVFEQLENGAWIVSRWKLRMPQQLTERTVSSGRSRITRLGTAVHETGGEVLAVEGVGTFRLVPEPLGTVQGRLVSVTGVPVTGALVYLSGTGYADSTDANGRFRLAGVREGRYVLSWYRDDLTDALGPAVPREVTVAADTVRDVTWRVVGAGALLEPPRFEHTIPLVPTATVRAQPPGGLPSLVSSPGSRSTRRR